MPEDTTEGDAKQKEVESNFRHFKERLPGLLAEHAGKFALMRHGDIVQFFDTARDAMIFGTTEYEDGLFSVQEVTDRVVDLGWYSHAAGHASV